VEVCGSSRGESEREVDEGVRKRNSHEREFFIFFLIKV
jgi:hypothetical protein